jgi:hypothetical protein
LCNIFSLNHDIISSTFSGSNTTVLYCTINEHSDVDALKSSREIACANPRNTQEKDPKFCSHLTVVKNVAGGTATPSQFTIRVTGNNPTPSTFQGSSSGTTVTLGQGSYQVIETPIADYTPTYSSECSGSISAGQTKTCTITNTYTPPLQTATLTVIKHVINDNGGTGQASDFTFNIAFTHCDNTVSPSGSFRGSESGVTFQLPTEGPDSICGYPVIETGLPNFCDGVVCIDYT